MWAINQVLVSFINKFSDLHHKDSRTRQDPAFSRSDFGFDDEKEQLYMPGDMEGPDRTLRYQRIP